MLLKSHIIFYFAIRQEVKQSGCANGWPDFNFGQVKSTINYIRMRSKHGDRTFLHNSALSVQYHFLNSFALWFLEVLFF